MSTNTHSPQAGDETSAARLRREAEGYFSRYFQGAGIDVGAGLQEVVPGCRVWDQSRGDGDATFLTGIKDAEFDWLYSSHCLEHISDPQLALDNWLRVVKPGGYLVVSVPDEDLYEQEIWPPIFNPDHRFSYTPFKTVSWNKDYSKNLVDLIRNLDGVKLISLRIVDSNYNYNKLFEDQPFAEKSVECIIQKLSVIPKVKESLRDGFSCFCGCRDLSLIGMYITGEILIRCRDCRHYSKCSITKMLENQGFKIEFPEYNT